METIEQISDEIIQCRLCPRLVEWRERIGSEKRRAFANEEYWARPVPYFGDPNALHLIVGLAPAAHGANRTGRMFTGDRSGDWLFAALFRAGVANQPTSVQRGDGLTLSGVLMAATCHCAPPDNKPSLDELRECNRYLTRILSNRDWKSVLCLGSIAWNNVHRTLGIRIEKFGHGAVHQPTNRPRLVASYHPSQQNTFTGKLTEPMLDAAIAQWLVG
ncbi:MAG: uracil-DNA glycosylase [Fimbriimonas sp.]|nr:uracil-DNA glycosylase [Fimbriimonas sp.]